MARFDFRYLFLTYLFYSLALNVQHMNTGKGQKAAAVRLLSIDNTSSAISDTVQSSSGFLYLLANALSTSSSTVLAVALQQAPLF